MRVSSRKLLEGLLHDGVPPEKFAAACIVVDKLEKIGAPAVVANLAALGLAKERAEALVGFMGIRDLAEARRAAPAAAEPALAELGELFELLEGYGVADRVVFDASIVRGLAYYTGVVFEAFDARGELRAVCGGGRYDRLLESLGGKALPAAGFGFGDAVIFELLQERGLLPALPRGLDCVVIAIPDAVQEAALRRAAIGHASALRREGAAVELALGLPLKRALRNADRAGAASVHLIGTDELRRGAVKVRDLATGEERERPLREAEAGEPVP